MMDDTEFTVNADTNSTSSLDLDSSIFQVLKTMQRDQHFPESVKILFFFILFCK